MVLPLQPPQPVLVLTEKIHVRHFPLQGSFTAPYLKAVLIKPQGFPVLRNLPDHGGLIVPFFSASGNCHRLIHGEGEGFPYGNNAVPLGGFPRENAVLKPDAAAPLGFQAAEFPGPFCCNRPCPAAGSDNPQGAELLSAVLHSPFCSPST